MTCRVLRPVRDFAEVWFTNTDHITFHDPLAATTIFDDRICAFEQGTVEVDLAEVPGRTLWRPGDTALPHQVAVRVAPQCFFDHYFGVFAS